MNTDEEIVALYGKMNPLKAVTAAPPIVANAIRRLQKKEEDEVRRRLVWEGEKPRKQSGAGSPSDQDQAQGGPKAK